MINATSRGEGATDVYLLRNGNGNPVTFRHWSQIDVLRVEDHSPNGDDIKFYSPEKGRMVWYALITAGYNRVDINQAV
jgi:hypothetical protein